MITGGNFLKSVTFGSIRADAITCGGALKIVEQLVDRGQGGVVFAVNVDGIVLAQENVLLRSAYARASLSLPDGMPLLWAARLLGAVLPEKVSGSDFVPFILEHAAEVGWKVYFLGGSPGIAALARDRICERLPRLKVVGVDSPSINLNDSASVRGKIVARIREASPDLVFVALGAPKQEIWIDLVRDELRPAVLFAVGGTLDFLSGKTKRAPAWISGIGLEWLFRLCHEPKRLWRRYLLRDPKFLMITARAMMHRFLGRQVDAYPTTEDRGAKK